MEHDAASWPYWPTLARLALSLGIGCFVGIERERRRKEAGLRTFAFAALLGGVGGLLGDAYALLVLALLGVLIVLLNVETIHKGEGAEITTSAALLLTGFAGVLAGQGHTFTPTTIGVATAALLAWKAPLAGFSVALTESEIRSAVLLAILAFVVYPVLPFGSVDPWHLVEPRAAWVTVILIAVIGFANYILLKLYGAHGIELTGFLGGLVNSTVTVTELAHRVRESDGAFADVAFRGVILATAAMLARNVVILALFAPVACREVLVPIALMLLVIGVAGFGRMGGAWRGGKAAPEVGPVGGALPALQSPFSLKAACQFGLIFLALEVGGTLAERALGVSGFLAVSAVGGVVSSASAVASAATLSAAGTLTPEVAAHGALIASMASSLVDFPIVARVGRNAGLTRRVGVVLLLTLVAGLTGVAVMRMAYRP